MDYNEEVYIDDSHNNNYENCTNIDWSILDFEVQDFLLEVLEEFRKSDPRFECISLSDVTIRSTKNFSKNLLFDESIDSFVRYTTNYLNDIFDKNYKKIMKNYNTIDDFYVSEEAENGGNYFINNYIDGTYYNIIYSNIFNRMLYMNVLQCWKSNFVVK
jgi:hypothetical protein